ncbi:MAG: hypothetical protein BWY52_03368 [Chloroflexi bacterium ADurb.Bin325]|nr:MAG: hypothetical protein BWY52_03368 [Chloroflexi bacterium ADurb.Bin325]
MILAQTMLLVPKMPPSRRAAEISTARVVTPPMNTAR